MTYSDSYADLYTSTYYDPTAAAAWLTVPGYAALFETVAPSSIALSGSDVTSWTDSTGTFTAAPSTGNAPSFPHGTLAGGYEAVEFDSANTESLDVALGIDSGHAYCCTFALIVDIGTVSNVFSVQSASGDEIAFQVAGAGSVELRHRRDIQGASGLHSSAGTFAVGAVAVAQFAYDGTNSHLRVSGSAEESSSLVTGTWTSTGSIFGQRVIPAAHFPGGLYCAAIYGGASGVPSSASLRDDVFTQVANRFGVTP